MSSLLDTGVRRYDENYVSGRVVIQKSLIFLLILFSTTASASLHPGWAENGWLTDIEIAQARARQTGRPIFLYFDAIWCSWCQVYKQKTLDKPVIQNKLTKDYIALVLDYDAQPQLFNQLGGRGLPFNVIMDSKGNVLNRFVGLLSVADLLEQLDKYDKPNVSEPAAETELFEPLAIEKLDAKSYEEFLEAYLQHIDTLYSKQHKTLTGFYDTGVTLKRPSPITWMWLMEQAEWKQRAILAAETESRHLWDAVDGGFFQYLQRTPPLSDYLETSKLLEVNARLAQWMARAGNATNKLQRIAQQAVTYLLDTLKDEETGAFFQSQIADQNYYLLAPEQRKKQEQPAVDKVIRMDTNAQSVLALIDLAQNLKQPALLTHAGKTLDFLLNNMRKDGEYYHLYNQGLLQYRADLSDEAWLLAAGTELQRISRDRNRDKALRELTHIVSQKLDSLIANPPLAPPEPETMGIIAWIAQHPLQQFQTRTRLSERHARWALKQIKLNSESPPDSLVMAIRSWKLLLDRQSASQRK